MALEAAFRELLSCLRQLHEALAALRLTVVEDQPAAGEAALADQRADALEDVCGRVEEGTRAAARAVAAARRRPPDFDAAREALAKCQETFNSAAYRFARELVSYDAVAELARFGRHRGGEWLAWAGGVRASLDRCEQPLYDANQALFRCWTEMTERAGANAVHVRNTAIGQRIIMPGGGQRAEPSREGMG